MVDRGRIELPPEPCKGPVLPLSLTAHGSGRGVRNRTESMWVKATCASTRIHYTPTNLASRQGLEPRPTVLETVMLPLHQRDILTHCCQCVYQKTQSAASQPGSALCSLIRYHFFIHTRISHPVGRPFAVLSDAGSRCPCT